MQNVRCIYLTFKFDVTEDEREFIDSIFDEIDCDEPGVTIDDCDWRHNEYIISLAFDANYTGSLEKTVQNLIDKLKVRVTAAAVFNINSYIGRKVKIVGGNYSGWEGIIMALPCAAKDADKKVLLYVDYDISTLWKTDIPYAELVD